MSADKGLLITLEGIEGVGKSTCLKFIARYLQKKNVIPVVTREPGGTPLSEKVRELVLGKQPFDVSDDAELLLFFAARAQHLQSVIFPAINNNQWVVCDRFTDTSYAYQGAGRGMGEKRIAILEQFTQGNFRPQATFLFDAPINLALSRTRRRGRLDRIESEKRQFFQKIRRCYLERAKNEPKRFYIIDARKPLSIVKQQLAQILDELLVKYPQHSHASK